MAEKNKNKKPLNDTLKNIFKRIETREDGGDSKFIQIWREVVGEAAYEHAKPKSFKKGKLVANVSNSARLYDLTLKKKEIIKNFNKKIGSEKIKEIRFKIGEL